MRRLRWSTLVVAALAVAAAADEPVAAKPPAPRDEGKSLIEAPVESAVLEHAARAEATKTRPGLVTWHADAAEAFAAAKLSGRPVLLFQLLGDLDDEFC